MIGRDTSQEYEAIACRTADTSGDSYMKQSRAAPMHRRFAARALGGSNTLDNTDAIS
jgi:hypothetical protein